MKHLLIPRLTAAAAFARLGEIEAQLGEGTPAKDLVTEHPGSAVPNPTGGSVATESDLRRWRSGVTEALTGVHPGTQPENAVHSRLLGQAIDEVIGPSASDAAHDGVWSFLALMLFPDVLASRWPAPGPAGALPKDRWIGRQAGRDRNYLKLAWRRWRIMGPVMEETGYAFGEDEFGALLERSAVARNVRLVRFAGQAVATYSGSTGRMEFTRSLMRSLTAETGPLQLDILSDDELYDLVTRVADEVDPRRS